MAKQDIYYIPTDNDYKSDPQYFSTRFGTKGKRFDPSKMDTEPIKPSILAKKVLKELIKFGNVISDDMPEQIESFARVFNTSIRYQQIKDSSFRLVYAAQTGTAKSLSLKIYVSMLKIHSSLIVVSKIDEALEYCKYINDLRGDESYARCYYSITDKNKANDLRVEKEDLKQYQCIVISHAMFQNINKSDSLNAFKLYMNKQRDLIVIDEKLNFYEKKEVSIKQIDMLYDTLSSFINNLNLDEQEYLSVILLILECIKRERKYTKKEIDEPLKRLNTLSIDFLNKQYQNLNEELDKIILLVKYKIKDLQDDIKSLGNIKSEKIFNSVLSNVQELIDMLKIMLDKDSDYENITYYYKSNYDESIFQVHNIANKLGSCVVLDATASINEFYKLAYLYSSYIIEIYAKPIRKYSNLTIHKAKGFRQGRSSTYRSLPTEDVTQNAKMYISYAKNLLSKRTDKMLVLTHKGFKLQLQKQCDDERIQFTHWGDHIGKNDWSDCNKVMIVGWNFIEEKEHISSAINAINDVDLSFKGITKEVINNFKTTQLADDLVQGVMRSKARRIATTDGNCKQTDVYIFYYDIKEYNDVLELFETQFPMCKLVEWKPVGIQKEVKKTRAKKNADLVINYLDQIAKENIDVMLKTVYTELEIKQYTMTRIISSEYFKEELEKKGYKIKNSNGKSKYFILK